jgi:class 3 adenylate cyclase
LIDRIVPPGDARGIEAEIRRVSLLFADIRGSTELVQHLDPEAAADVLGPPIHAMIEEVERFEGVASDRGDGVMAVFGAPSASEDHAVRACLAALAIQDRLSSGSSAVVKVRIGIHFGEVVFRRGRIGKLHMQDVFGVAAHIAARIEQTAEPGTICLSRAAYDLAQGFVKVLPLPPVKAKGIEEPIERVLLIGADQNANRFEVRVGRGLAGFANRSRELAILRGALNTGETGLKLIQLSGPAGIGKSRLIHELFATDDARGCHVVKFTGDPHRQNAAYYPVSAWLRTVLDIRSSDSTAEALAKLTRKLELVGTDARERDQLVRMLGLGSREGRDLTNLADTRSLHVAALIATMILRDAAGRQIILACEDIDNFDPTSRDLIPSLAEALGHAETLLVTTSRPRFRLPSVKAATSRSLALSALTDGEAIGLLANLNPSLPKSSALTATILQKAGGNPLFLEEVAALIGPRGAGGGRPPKQSNAGADEQAFGIPDRVEALIADRLGRLPKQQRRVVQACAVIGIDVPLRIAAKLLGVPEATLHSRLLKLSEPLLYETRKYPDPQFSFKHALTRDVAYNTILPSKRREYHARIVEILEGEAVASHDQHLDDLCMHAVQARMWAKAVRYLRLAAGAAADRSSYEVAELYLNRALDICKEIPDDADTLRSRIEILLGLRALVGANSKNVEARRLLDQAEELAAKLGDQELQLRIMVMRVYVLSILGDLGAAVLVAERSREVAKSLGKFGTFVLATFHLGQAHFNMGNFAAAEKALSDNLELLAEARFESPPGTLGTLPVLTYVTRAMVRAFTGEFAGATLDSERALEHARRSERPYDLSFASFGRGFVHLQQRSSDAAAQAFHDSLSLGESREMTDPSSLPPLLRAAGADELRRFESTRAALPHSQVGLGQALLLKGDVDGATHWLSQGYENARRANRYMIQIWAATCLAHIHVGTGQVELAARHADEAVEIATRFGFNGYRVAALRVRGLVRTLGGPGDIDDGLTAAIELAARLGMRTEVAHCHAAMVVARIGDRTHHLNSARDIYGELEMTEWLEQILNLSASNRIVYC